MKSLIFLLAFLFVSIYGFAQSRYYIKADSIYMEKTGGNSELIILNAGRVTQKGGVLYNTGGGRTAFKKTVAINDSAFIVGDDTVTIRGTGAGGTTLTNASGSGDTLLIGSTIKRLEAGYGIDRTVSGTNILDKVDTASANGVTTRSELKDTTSSLRRKISDSLIYALKSILIPSRIEFIASADTASYQDDALIGAQIMMLSIESYQVGFTVRSTSVYMSFDSSTGTITLTNGEFADDDQVIIIYRTAPVFLLDGLGNPIRDGSGNFIILN
jgi:hypothetical protein